MDKMQSDSAIELSQLSYSYNKQPFIEDLNLTIPKGQITSIIGPNGCGKTTLFKLIDGILKPQKGNILIEGKSIGTMSGKERAQRLALLVQGARPPAMDVETLVACGRYPRQENAFSLSQEDKHHVHRAMELAGVLQFRNHDVRFLSGGERQRAYIAMTLAQDTSIVALDEPTTYLDAHACHELLQLVRKLNREDNKTVLMVIHDLDLALRYSDNIIVLEKGKLLCSGSVDEVLDEKAIERAFGVEVCRSTSKGKTAYSLFPLISNPLESSQGMPGKLAF